MGRFQRRGRVGDASARSGLGLSVPDAQHPPASLSLNPAAVVAPVNAARPARAAGTAVLSPPWPLRVCQLFVASPLCVARSGTRPDGSKGALPRSRQPDSRGAGAPCAGFTVPGTRRASPGDVVFQGRGSFERVPAALTAAAVAAAHRARRARTTSPVVPCG